VGPLEQSGGSSIGKGRESDVACRDHQDGSHSLFQLRTNEFTLASKY
jgi:hypothetical protein